VFFSPVVLAAGEAACDAQNIMFCALSLDRAEKVKVKTVQIRRLQVRLQPTG
jgi:hypothetical protein